MLTDRDFNELFPDEPASATHAIGTADRRHEARIPVVADVIVATGEHFFTGLSSDVCVGGVFVSTYRAIDVGTRVSLEMQLPTGQLLARGVVRWVRRAGVASETALAGIGIAFEGLSEIDRAALEKFCGDRPRFITYDEVRSAAS